MVSQNAAQAEDTLARMWAITALRHHVQKKAEEKDAGDSKKGAEVIVRRWLDLHPGEALEDGEWGLIAQYRTKKTSGQFDVGSMPDEAIAALARAGCFVAAPESFTDAVSKTNPRLGDLVRRFRMPGGESKELRTGPR